MAVFVLYLTIVLISIFIFRPGYRVLKIPKINILYLWHSLVINSNVLINGWMKNYFSQCYREIYEEREVSFGIVVSQ